MPSPRTLLPLLLLLIVPGAVLTAQCPPAPFRGDPATAPPAQVLTYLRTVARSSCIDEASGARTGAAGRFADRSAMRLLSPRRGTATSTDTTAGRIVLAVDRVAPDGKTARTYLYVWGVRGERAEAAYLAERGGQLRIEDVADVLACRHDRGGPHGRALDYSVFAPATSFRCDGPKLPGDATTAPERMAWRDLAGERGDAYALTLDGVIIWVRDCAPGRPCCPVRRPPTQ